MPHPHRRCAGPQGGRLVCLAGFGGQRDAVRQQHTRAQRLQLRVGGRAFNLHQVGFLHLEARAADARLQSAVTRQQQQALAVGVQPPAGVNARQVNIVLQPTPAPLGCELAQHTVGLVKTKQVACGHS